MITILTITMLFGGGLIPTYLTISSYNLIDTFFVFVLPSAANAYHMILMKNFISQLPEEMLEAARNAIAEQGFDKVYETTAGCTVSSHCGKNTIGVLYINDGGNN